MGFIEHILRERQKKSFEEQQQQDEKNRIKQNEENKRIQMRNYMKEDRGLAISYLNESIIPQLLVEYKNNIDSGADIFIGAGYPSARVIEWPLDEKIEDRIVNYDWFEEDDLRNVGLRLEWGRKGHDYNCISFRYKPNGDIEVDSGSGKLRLSLRKWRNNQDFQNKVLENAYKHPHKYNDSPGLIY